MRSWEKAEVDERFGLIRCQMNNWNIFDISSPVRMASCRSSRWVFVLLAIGSLLFPHCVFAEEKRNKIKKAQLTWQRYITAWWQQFMMLTNWQADGCVSLSIRWRLKMKTLARFSSSVQDRNENVTRLDNRLSTSLTGRNNTSKCLSVKSVGSFSIFNQLESQWFECHVLRVINKSTGFASCVSFLRKRRASFDPIESDRFDVASLWHGMCVAENWNQQVACCSKPPRPFFFDRRRTMLLFFTLRRRFDRAGD